MGCKFPVRYLLLCCLVFVILLLWSGPSFLPFTRMLNSGDPAFSNSLSGGDVNSNSLNEKDQFTMLGIVRNQEDKDVRAEGYNLHAFNLLISNRLGFHRKIPDTRNPLCWHKKYFSNLPTASVIICFYNEAWSVLLRTIHSVLDNSPSDLLCEIILIDDFSSLNHLKTKLDDYVANLPNVHIVRTRKREGLIRGRMIGAQTAKADVLVFLDSHCEVNVDWLPPLLERIKEDQKTAVCPIIDMISSDTFEYTASPLVRGGFNWGLHFSWEPIPSSLLRTKEDFVKPIRSPTMAGGLFAIDRKYFTEIGQYDEGMDIWGGENLELSFKLWMCGGKLEIIPCSRVGHVFRRRRPYGSDSKGDTTSYNSMRLAEVWLDDYKQYFYNIRKDLSGQNYGDISSRVELRKKLNCKSFKWFLKNIYPEMSQPQGYNAWQQQQKKHPAIIWKGQFEKHNTDFWFTKQLKNVGEDLCLDTPGSPHEKKVAVILHECGETNAKHWGLNEDHELKINSLLCLEMPDFAEASVRVMKCRGEQGPQQWRYTKKTGRLYHPASGLCLSTKKGSYRISMEICDNSPRQQWTFS